jgi:hypothetical protein
MLCFLGKILCKYTINVSKFKRFAFLVSDETKAKLSKAKLAISCQDIDSF